MTTPLRLVIDAAVRCQEKYSIREWPSMVFVASRRVSAGIHFVRRVGATAVQALVLLLVIVLAGMQVAHASANSSNLRLTPSPQTSVDGFLGAAHLNSGEMNGHGFSV